MRCRVYTARAFGDRRREAGEAKKPLTAMWPPGELNRVKCRLHDRIRPAVSADVEGWGRKRGVAV